MRVPLRATIRVPLCIFIFGCGVLAALSGAAGAADFQRGDVNDDGSFDIADAVTGLAHLFGGAPLELSYLVAGRVERRFLHPNIDAGREPGPTQRVPVFVARDGGRARRVVRSAEIRRFAAVLRILKEARTRPALPDPGKSALLRLRGSAAGELLAADLFELPVELAVPAVTAQLDLPDDLADLPRTDRVLAVRAIATGAPDPESGRLLSFFVARDAESGRIVAGDLYPGATAEVPLDAWERLLRAETPHPGPEDEPYPPGLPREIRFCDPPLFETVCAALALLGIEAELDPEHPDFAAIERFWGEMMGKFERVVEAIESAETDDGEFTFEAWKEMDASFFEPFERDVRALDTPATRALYYGVPVVPERALDKYGPCTLHAFHDWLVDEFRRTPGAPTLLEKRLARRDLRPIERAYLEARAGGTIALLRVIGAVPGESIDLIDVDTQERHLIPDSVLSRGASPGMLFFLRLYRTGSFTSCSIAGPPVLPSEVDLVLRALDDARRSLPASGSNGLADLLPTIGGLWDLLAEDRPTPEMQNTSGETLRPQIQTFDVKDPMRTEVAITARQDTDRDPDGAQLPAERGRVIHWTWLDRRANPKLAGLPTILGRIRLEGRSLQVETNSDERAAKARKWLERIAGVRHEGTKRLSMEEAMRPPGTGEWGGAPASAREGGRDSSTTQEESRVPMTKELLDLVVPQLRRQLLGWIDEKIPALGGRTPRQACKTEEGRTQVTRMIQTMRDPGGNPELTRALDFEGVRRAMLRELRLER
jgi:hypothetical protein